MTIKKTKTNTIFILNNEITNQLLNIIKNTNKTSNQKSLNDATNMYNLIITLILNECYIYNHPLHLILPIVYWLIG